MNDRRRCDYCGLTFTGSGYSPEGDREYCCYGCCLAERIMGAQGEEGIAAWLIVRLGLGAFLSMNVMMLSLILYTVPARELGMETFEGLRWAIFGISIPAILILGTPLLVSALRSLRKGRLTMDLMIVSGSFTAFGVGTASVIRGSGHIYFDTSTMLLLIVTLGRLLEASAKMKTSKAIREVIDLIPSTARVLKDGCEIETPISEVCSGNLLLVKPGERIPADGVIIDGRCMIEESAFTGESQPRPCEPGDKVYGGSIDCDGLITVRATAVGADSLLSEMQRMVRQAQLERAPVERLAEKVSCIFVPIVWVVALAAGAYWGIFRSDWETAWMSALAVMVVACPCALGIATPVATCLAIGKAARAAVLIRSGEVLERLPAIYRVFFDKTGTLTTNQLSVSEVVVTDDAITADQALAVMASVEAGSEHSIARAIIAAADGPAHPCAGPTFSGHPCPQPSVDRDMDVPGTEAGVMDDPGHQGHQDTHSALRIPHSAFETFPGRGIAAVVPVRGEMKRVTVGSLSLLAEEHELPQDFDLTADRNQLTTVYVGWDGKVRAAVLLQDTTRGDAKSAVEELRALGIRTAVISGDRKGPVTRISEELGIEKSMYERTPGEKALTIRKVRHATRRKVAMVGDGINDAPALAEADVGIAIGSGTDLARQASDVTLLGDDLTRIPWLFLLARRTYKVIRLNLWFAFGYNAVAVVLAALGYVHPLIAALAMLVSSLAVISNSMRLLRGSDEE